MADTLHNLGETLGRMGKYDQALARYLRALDSRRAAGDTRTAAMESYSIGTIFDYQGRYGAAVKSKGEALQAFRDLKQRDFWLGEILSGLGYSLALGGRADEASKSLDEALTLARELKNPGLVAQVLRFQAENAFFKGDAAAPCGSPARRFRQAASASDRSLDLWARFVAANIAAAATPSKAAAATLAQIAQRAESGGPGLPLGLLRGAAGAMSLLRSGDSSAGTPARRKTRWPEPRRSGFANCRRESEYVVGAAMRMADDAQSRRRYTTALQLLEELAREDGSQKLLERADLKAIHAECVRWSKTL